MCGSKLKLLFLQVGIFVLCLDGYGFMEKTNKLQDSVIVTPSSYSRALHNPLKGLTDSCEWNTLVRMYIGWDEIESSENDGIAKITTYCDRLWKDFPAQGIKVVPRVYLLWTNLDKPRETHWPADMEKGDFSSEKFIVRCEKLIDKLGQAWNNDPRVAFIQMGLIGKWGEQHSPSPTPEVQKRLAVAFNKAFTNKKVEVRHVWMEFNEGYFGEYWDSFAHFDQMNSHGKEISDFNKSTGNWKTNPIGGEPAYDWGNINIQPGKNSTESLSNPVHLDYFINCVKWLHATQLNWISKYDQTNKSAREGAEKLQKVFGYRFEIPKTTIINKNGKIDFEIEVINTGSAPFYYKWPVQVVLIDPETRRPIKSEILDKVDIRSWLCGAGWTDPVPNDPNWGKTTPKWENEPKINKFKATITVPSKYSKAFILAITILDPQGGNCPAIRFASSDYLNGGYTCLGMVWPNGACSAMPADFKFDNPIIDGKKGRLPYYFKRNQD